MLRNFLIISFLFISITGYGQKQDVQFHLNAHLLADQKILKVKRDYNDIYLWVLGQNNTVYRVNSETLAVDDYTSKFTAYSNFQFSDIAGHSADTVFIVSNTPNIIEYQSGTIRVFNSADGIPGDVNSIGVDIGWNINNRTSKGKMLFATDNGLRYLNPTTQNIEFLSDLAPYASNSGISAGKLYECTYRNQVYKDSSGSDLSGWATDTLRYLPTTFNGNGSLETSYIFEDDKNFGTNVNTVTNLQGYLDPSYGYFSSFFWGNEKGMFECYPTFSYHYGMSPTFHFLDHIKVNKITDIMGLTGFNIRTLIKQNLLIGTDQGLYFSSSNFNPSTGSLFAFSLFHDDELGNIVINDINVNAVPDANPICENGVWIAANDGLYLLKPDYTVYLNNQQQKFISFQNQVDTVSQYQLCTSSAINAIAFNNSANIQWFKDGQELPAQSKDTLSITAAGDYNAVIYDPCSNIHIETNHLKVSLISAPVFTFNYPDNLQYCGSTPVDLQVTNNPSYHYRWYQDGVLNGDTSSILTVTQAGNYNIELSACNGTWIASKQVNINFTQIEMPVITTDKPAYCLGDNAALSINQPADPADNIYWYRDNVLLNNFTGKSSITTNIAGDYAAEVINTKKNTDGTTCRQTSAPQIITFATKQTVSITQRADKSLCNGQTVYLNAVYNSGTIQWSTGQTTDQIAVTTTGTYKVTLETPGGCVSDTSVDITFLTNPILNVNDTTICTYKKQTITLNAPSGFNNYSWNGQNGNQFFQVNSPQTVNLEVTDNNGCTATTQIKVVEHCADVEIPNTFTPNGDLINDYWVIEGLDQTATVKIFNRYGSLLYQSIGNYTPWDGTYKHSKLPSGVYYYIIKVKGGKQTFSGSVTIVY